MRTISIYGSQKGHFCTDHLQKVPYMALLFPGLPGQDCSPELSRKPSLSWSSGWQMGPGLLADSVPTDTVSTSVVMTT